MKFKKAIVTSGPTREWLDPVRYISNASSGKMGFYLALELKKWISNTIYIHGNVMEKYSLFPGDKISVESTRDMLDAILKRLESNTILIMAAAPADFRPINYNEQKVKKNNSSYNLELIENPDILKTIDNFIFDNNFINIPRVGFAAETENLEENALIKLKKKNLNYIIANHVGRDQGFGEDNSTVFVYSTNGIELQILDKPKEQIAKEIVEFLKMTIENIY